MALILRGNGVVEGLTDLPAGVISVADIPDGEITADKLHTTLDLSGKTVTLHKNAMPSGSVLQVQHHVVTTNYTGTGGTNRDFPAWDFTFTPNFSTSKVFVMISVGINMICDGNVYLKRNGTIVKDTWFGSTRSDDIYDYPQASAFYLDSPATASAINYKVGGRATGCTNIIRFGGSDNHASMTFMEVAG